MENLKSFNVIILCVFLYCCSAVYAEDCKVLTVSGAYNWAPYLLYDKDTKKISGVSYEIVKIIGERLNIPVKFKVNIPWKRILLWVEKGKIEMCAAIYWNEERDKLYNYSIPILQDEIRAFVLKGNEFKFNSFKDLEGKKGGIPFGASFGFEFDTYAKKHLKIDSGSRNKNALFTKLSKGRNDYFVSALFDVSIALKKAGLQDKIVALPKAITVNKVYFIMPKNSPCSGLLPKINSIIKSLQEDGTIKRILNKYIK
ncbi:MAG: amino acid ABC transporter substrate-binding protein [Desulfobacterales bacterium]|nr:amino acid ABC transporter substrate-binding protein [Desulfobacterales bacterium]MCP4164211.1 amino acid ABC transporter substrate-binding protein [Deltaproteobacteria bacterium]